MEAIINTTAEAIQGDKKERLRANYKRYYERNKAKEQERKKAQYNAEEKRKYYEENRERIKETMRATRQIKREERIMKKLDAMINKEPMSAFMKSLKASNLYKAMTNKELALLEGVAGFAEKSAGEQASTPSS